jgi:hypothetical protein
MIHLQPNNESLQWSMKRVYVCANNGFTEATIGGPFYKRDDAWHSMNLFGKNCARRLNPFIS